MIGIISAVVLWGLAPKDHTTASWMLEQTNGIQANPSWFTDPVLVFVLCLGLTTSQVVTTHEYNRDLKKALLLKRGNGKASGVSEGL